MSRHQTRLAQLEQAAAEKARARAWPGDLVRITLTPHAADIAQKARAPRGTRQRSSRLAA